MPNEACVDPICNMYSYQKPSPAPFSRPIIDLEIERNRP